MNLNVQNLTQKRNKLRTSARNASTLAVAERELADQQHLVAHNLEILAEDLADQVTAVEVEIRAADTP